MRRLLVLTITLLSATSIAGPSDKLLPGEGAPCQLDKANSCKGPTVCTTVRNKGTNGVHDNICLRPCALISECPAADTGILLMCDSSGFKRFIEKNQKRCLPQSLLD